MNILSIIRRSIVFSFLLTGCANVSHPYFTQIAYTNRDVNTIRYINKSSSQKATRQIAIEVYELMASKCKNYIILKGYLTGGNSTEGVIINPNLMVTHYASITKSYVNLDFVCGRQDSIITRTDISKHYCFRGHEKLLDENYEGALNDFNKSIELDNKNWVAYDWRQETKFKMNDILGCIEDCSAALAINEKCGNSYMYRGKAYLIRGQKDKACQDFKKGIECERKGCQYLMDENCK